MNYATLLDRHFNESQQRFIRRTVRINAMIGGLKDNTYQELVDVLGYNKDQEPLLRNIINKIYKQMKDEKKYGISN